MKFTGLFVLRYLPILLFSTHLCSQTIDVNNHSIDSVLSWMKQNYSVDSLDVHQVGLDALRHTASLDDLKLIGDIHTAIADWLGYNGMLPQDSLLFHVKQALSYYEELGDKELIAKTYSSLGIDLLNAAKLDESQEVIFKSITLFEELDDPEGIANAHRSLAYLHERMDEPLLAIDYGKKAYDYYKSVEDFNRMTYTLLSQIQSYQSAEMYDEARQAGRECILIVEEKVPDEVFVLGRAYSYLSDVEIADGNLDQALDYSKRAFAIVSNEVGKERASSYMQGMADVMRLQGKWQEASKVYEEILEYAEYQGSGTYYILYKHLSECYEGMGDFEASLSNMKKYSEFALKANDETIENLKSEAVVKYETAQKDKEIAVQEATIKQKSRVQKVTYIALAVLIALLSLLFNLYRQNQKTNQALQAKIDENQLLVKEIHHRVKNNLQILSSLLSLQSDTEQDQEVLSALQEGRNRVEAMGMIHQRLYSKDNLSAIDMKPYVDELCQFLADMAVDEKRELTIDTNIKIGLVDVETAIPLGLIINELVTNSLKYGANENGETNISVDLLINDMGNLQLQVSDNGEGLLQNKNHEKSTSFGSQLVTILSKKLKGSITTETSNGYTTTIDFSRYTLIE